MRSPSRPPSPRRRLVRRLAISLVIALACAVWSVSEVSLVPPDVRPRHIDIAGASTHVLVDAERSFILDHRADITDFTSLTWRAELYGNLMATKVVRELIGRRIGVPADDITAIPRLTGGMPDGLRDPDSEHGAELLRTVRNPYRLDIQADPVRPVLSIYAQAPTQAAAVELADASVAALREHLQGRGTSPGAARHGRIATLEQVGPARGAVINATTRPQIILLTFLVAFAGCFALLAAASAVRRGWLAGPSSPGSPEPLTPRRSWFAWSAASPIDDPWPHTTRALPWAVAVFMVVLWLMPFNTIELTASLPFDLKFDRLVLPLVFGLWVLALAVGGRNAPRIHVTPIHVAVAVLGLVASLSVVFNALELNQALEFDLGIKKLSLLISYGVFFLIVASSVRPAEVPAFLKLMLALALLAALGTVWEHRMGYNAFYDLSDKLLPPIFEVGASEAGLVDVGGRSLTRGPGEHPLEIVAMLSMALPLTLMGIIDSARRRTMLLYAIATALLLAAALSTDRKSSLLAPLAVGLMLAYYRRGQLIRFAPLGVALVFGVQFLAPGAVTSVVSQLSPDQLGVGTVSDRASDYDAVRPNLWTHLLVGRGYGTYDHVSYRILDSEMLNRLLDTGLLGVLALFGMLVAIIVAANRLIRTGRPALSTPALVAAPAAVAYGVLAFLFDVGSFPHAPYTLMCIAGLLAVTVAGRDEERSQQAEEQRPVQRYIGYGASDPDRVARAERGGAHRAGRPSRGRAGAATGALDHQRRPVH
jgi:hypothetical protein